MGLWIAFGFVISVFCLMAWSVFSTHQRTPPETPLESKAFFVQYLDPADVLLVVAIWLFSLRLTLGPGYDALLSDRRSSWALLLLSGSGAVWLRRRLFPRTVLRFDAKNVALRSASVFSTLASVGALAFGTFAGWLEEPSWVAGSFFLTAGALAVLGVGLYALEFRRRPRQVSPSAAGRSDC